MKTQSWYFKNIEHAKQYQKAYREANPAKFTAKQALRKARLLNATPSWLTPEMKSQMEKLYEDARKLSKEHKMSYHVDHIVPLKGSDICGLHVPWNLRVIPGNINCAKGSKLDFKDSDALTLNSDFCVNNRYCKTVICYETSKEYYSISQCAREFNTTPGTISSIATGRKRSHKGYHFFYKTDLHKLPELIKQWKYERKNKFQCIQTGEVFYSFKHASEILGISHVYLAKCVKSGKSCKGYSFRVLPNPNSTIKKKREL